MDQLTVQYERKYSDGNYGSEGLSMTMEWSGSFTDEQALTLAHRLRETVLTFLAASAAGRVAAEAKHELHLIQGELAAPTTDQEEDVPF